MCIYIYKRARVLVNVYIYICVFERYIVEVNLSGPGLVAEHFDTLEGLRLAAPSEQRVGWILVRIYSAPCVCMYVCVYVCVCVCVCVCHCSASPPEQRVGCILVRIYSAPCVCMYVCVCVSLFCIALGTACWLYTGSYL